MRYDYVEDQYRVVGVAADGTHYLQWFDTAADALMHARMFRSAIVVRPDGHRTEICPAYEPAVSGG
jgi:hypothetical protein